MKNRHEKESFFIIFDSFPQHFIISSKNHSFLPIQLIKLHTGKNAFKGGGNFSRKYTPMKLKSKTWHLELKHAIKLNKSESKTNVFATVLNVYALNPLARSIHNFSGFYSFFSNAIEAEPYSFFGKSCVPPHNGGTII